MFNVALRTGAIPPPPDVIQGQEMKIEYISILAQAQKVAFTAAIEKVTQFVAGIAQTDPTVWDNFNLDETVKEYADMTGVPQKLVQSLAMVQAVRQKRQQQQDAANKLQLAGHMVEGAKTMSETKLGTNSALDQAMGNENQPAGKAA